MPYDFDHAPARRDTDSLKWQRYGTALPLWVADMDFTAPEPVLAALQARIAHGVFGYGAPPVHLSETVCARLPSNGWITADDIVYLTGAGAGLTGSPGR